MRPNDRERVQIAVTTRVVERYQRTAARAADGFLETAINDTLYHERRRLERERGAPAQVELAFYDEVQRRLRGASTETQLALLELMARRFVAEVVGNFDERIYKISTKVVPVGLWMLLNAMSPRRLLSRDVQSGLADHLAIAGETAHVRGLLDKGTLIVVPTHLSNLDSPLIGYMAYLAGLPPLAYGAGLNLFHNPLIGFFMQHLGAYKVDRKKSAALYKEVLKEYATVSLEMGYHNLFFPGGTRSRGGLVEKHLKMGLLGTGVRAFVDNLRAGREKPNLYIVPVTLNYKLVLEAETLIDDHLKETGKSRYIIEDDEFSRPRRVAQFIENLISLDARIAINFSRPLDIFGNFVDEEGRSLDAHGRVVDARRYVLGGDEPVHDDQRDAEYTRELAEAISAAYHRDTVIMSTHLVSACLFRLLERYNPGLDLYRILRTGGASPSFPMIELHDEVERVLGALRRHPGGPKLEAVLAAGDVPEIVADALKHFAIYHTRPAAVRRGDRVFHEDRNLLLYYGNRLAGYELEHPAAPEAVPASAAASAPDPVGARASA
jgi:glycerol-3-phosphate O-acyltransferase